MEIHQLRYFVVVAEDPPSPRLRRDKEVSGQVVLASAFCFAVVFARSKLAAA